MPEVGVIVSENNSSCKGVSGDSDDDSAGGSQMSSDISASLYSECGGNCSFEVVLGESEKISSGKKSAMMTVGMKNALIGKDEGEVGTVESDIDLTHSTPSVDSSDHSAEVSSEEDSSKSSSDIYSGSKDERFSTEPDIVMSSFETSSAMAQSDKAHYSLISCTLTAGVNISKENRFVYNAKEISSHPNYTSVLSFTDDKSDASHPLVNESYGKEFEENTYPLSSVSGSDTSEVENQNDTLDEVDQLLICNDQDCHVNDISVTTERKSNNSTYTRSQLSPLTTNSNNKQYVQENMEELLSESRPGKCKSMTSEADSKEGKLVPVRLDKQNKIDKKPKLKRKNIAVTKEQNVFKSLGTRSTHASNSKSRKFQDVLSPVRTYIRNEPTPALIKAVKPLDSRLRKIPTTKSVDQIPQLHLCSATKASAVPNRDRMFSSPQFALPIVSCASHPAVNVNYLETEAVLKNSPKMARSMVTGSITPKVTRHIGHAQISSVDPSMRLDESRVSIVETRIASRTNTLKKGSQQNYNL